MPQDTLTREQIARIVDAMAAGAKESHPDVRGSEADDECVKARRNKKAGVGNFPDFVCSPTRTTHPRGGVRAGGQTNPN